MMAVSPTARNALTVMAALGVIGLLLMLHTPSKSTVVTQISYNDNQTNKSVIFSTSTRLTQVTTSLILDFTISAEFSESEEGSSASSTDKSKPDKNQSVGTEQPDLVLGESSSTTTPMSTSTSDFSTDTRSSPKSDLKSSGYEAVSDLVSKPGLHNIPITHWTLDFQQMPNGDIGTMLEQRKARVSSKCDSMQGIVRDTYANTKARIRRFYNRITRILTDYEKGISFCFSAKTGSTFWKSVFIYMQTGNIENGLKYVRYLPKQSQNPIRRWANNLVASSFPSFVAVRNPWKRLVSLYQQKIEPFIHSDGSPPNGKEKGNMPYFFLLQVCHRKPYELTQFSDLLDCVLWSWDRGTPNIHWVPVYEICDVCEQNFDFIIRVENMMEEGAYVMRRAGINNAKEILETVRKGTIRDVELHRKHRPTSDYYQDIPLTTINRLRDMYKHEIELFDYPDTPFTDL